MVGDPAVNPIAQRFRNQARQREAAPPAAEHPRELDQGVTAEEHRTIAFPQQDQGAAGFRRVVGETHLGGEFPLQRCHGKSFVNVETHRAAHGFRAKRAVAIKE